MLRMAASTASTAEWPFLTKFHQQAVHYSGPLHIQFPIQASCCFCNCASASMNYQCVLWFGIRAYYKPVLFMTGIKCSYGQHNDWNSHFNYLITPRDLPTFSKA